MKEDWRGLLFFGAIGNRFHITLREVQYFTRQPSFLLFALLIAAILLVFDTQGEFYGIPLGVMSFLVILHVATFIALYIAFLLVSIKISQRFSGFFVYSPMIVVVVTIISTVIENYLYTVAIGERPSFIQPLDGVMLNIASALIFETLFLLFAIPLILPNKSKSDEQQKAKTRQVTIAGKNFPIADIHSISSQDHYVEVKAGEASSLLRARLVDVIAQIDDEFGISPHRSHWVSKAAIDEIKGTVSGKVLKLKNGEEIPIARGRVKTVRDWLEETG